LIDRQAQAQPGGDRPQGVGITPTAIRQCAAHEATFSEKPRRLFRAALKKKGIGTPSLQLLEKLQI